MSKTYSFRCTFNKTRQISQNKATVIFRFNHSKIRNNRREMIVSNFRSCCRNNGKQASISQHLGIQQILHQQVI